LKKSARIGSKSSPADKRGPRHTAIEPDCNTHRW
jgi:hypothetical protein